MPCGVLSTTSHAECVGGAYYRRPDWQTPEKWALAKPTLSTEPHAMQCRRRRGLGADLGVAELPERAYSDN